VKIIPHINEGKGAILVSGLHLKEKEKDQWGGLGGLQA
jgi:hypothetical protein